MHKWKQIISRFLCIGEPDSVSSQDLYNYRIHQIKCYKIYNFMNKFIDIGSDEVCNMIGVNKWAWYFIKGASWNCHWLELAFSKTPWRKTRHDKIATLLLAIYFFQKQTKDLKNTFKVNIILGFFSQIIFRNYKRCWMYVIIGSHFVSFEGNFLLIALVIVSITLNVIVRQMPPNVPYTTVYPSFKNFLSNS